VDDNRILHNLYREILKMEGHTIFDSAFDGKQCLEKLNGSGANPDYILMDYRMPVINGLETMKKLLKSDPARKIIFISADDSVEEEALSAGAIMFVKKPFNLDTIYTSIKRLSK
jgi:CheY-like chemotaxis protein